MAVSSNSLPLKVAAATFALHFVLLTMLWSSFIGATEAWVMANSGPSGVLLPNAPPPPQGTPLLKFMMFPFVSMAIVRTGGVFGYLDQIAQSATWALVAFWFAGGRLRPRSGRSPTPGA